MIAATHTIQSSNAVHTLRSANTVVDFRDSEIRAIPNTLSAIIATNYLLRSRKSTDQSIRRRERLVAKNTGTQSIGLRIAPEKLASLPRRWLRLTAETPRSLGTFSAMAARATTLAILHCFLTSRNAGNDDKERLAL